MDLQRTEKRKLELGSKVLGNEKPLSLGDEVFDGHGSG